MYRPRLHIPPAICVGAMLAGCTSISGLTGSSSYACKAPDGVTCDSVSGTYANAVQNNLPSQRSRTAALPIAPAAAGSATARSAEPTQMAMSSVSPTPLRSSARILRLWFKPWEDADRDLYDQGYVYVQIDNGQWLVDHAQRQIRDAYAPLRPPPKGAASAGDGKERSALPPNLMSGPRPPSADNPFPGLVPPAARVESSD
ncbi:MAG: type IV conjugative transfer system lipoprotein TraV [Burkholderiales bacterium]|nr:type IV conjugative transfer system lipoprotein TraV [Burkholderiales bacterium]